MPEAVADAAVDAYRARLAREVDRLVEDRLLTRTPRPACRSHHPRRERLLCFRAPDHRGPHRNGRAEW